MENIRIEKAGAVETNSIQRRERELLIETRARLFQQRRRELLKQAHWRLAVGSDSEGEKGIVVRCPNCGAHLERITV